jgi:amino acid transporter
MSDGDSTQSTPSAAGTRVPVVLATSVMLTFLSFWRAAAIVLCDLGSSAFYVGGIAERAIGRAAPWFIFGVMLFSYAVRSVYVESCAMFTRGGVYRVVKETLGGTFAKLSVSALMFDYILTGPISGVSAGQYIVGLVAQTATYLGHPWNPSKEAVNLIAAGIAALITVYFWWRNTKGLHESSDDALRIMGVTTVMVVLLIAWSGWTILTRPETQRLPPAPSVETLSFNDDAVGWLPVLAPGALQPTTTEDGQHRFVMPNAGMLIGLIGILMAFGHSILAMSGEESLAQVNRELEYPKHRNLMRAGLVIFVYSMLFTSLVSFFAYAIIPDGSRPEYFDNLISGIAMNVAGPTPLKLLFQAFIVIVGFLMLAGAVNTAIIGSNGVLNRVSEDGVLAPWFRSPHRRYGTSYRIINLIAILQLATILASRGNVYTLGEAYAFGVMWSFAFNAVAVLALRFKDKSPREWKVPLNPKLGRTEIPLGLGMIAVTLFAVVAINLVTKQVATISGAIFTVAFFALFTFSERISRARAREQERHPGLDEFQLIKKAEVNLGNLNVRPGPVLVGARDYRTLRYLETALEETDTRETDVVVMTARIIQGTAAGYREIFDEHLFTDYEQLLFTHVVAFAEKMGKPVKLLTVTSNNPFSAVVTTALDIGARRLYVGASEKLPIQTQARLIGQAWEKIDDPDKVQFDLIIVPQDGPPHRFQIGAHTPEIKPEDVDLIHSLWLDLSNAAAGRELRHRDVVSVALQSLAHGLAGPERDFIIEQIRSTASRPRPRGVPRPKKN